MEEGKHAAESGMDLKQYAEKSGKVRKTLTTKVLAFRVMSVADVGHEAARDAWRNLAEIHAAPPLSCSPTLIAKLSENCEQADNCESQNSVSSQWIDDLAKNTGTPKEH